MKEISFSDPLYECEISYLEGGTVNDLISFISERHPGSLPVSWDRKFEWGENANTTNGYQFHMNAPLGDGERFYIWVAYPTLNLVSHEVFHLTGDILFTRGIEYCYQSEEAFAYLHGWLIDKIFKTITWPVD